jgi:hypothetical protein
LKLKPETIAQIQVREWVIQNTDLPFIHVANERLASPAMGSILKRMGVRSGVSDIFIPRANKTQHGLFIELKVGVNKPTPSQLQFINEMIAEGYGAFVAYGSEEAILIIKQFYQILS